MLAYTRRRRNGRVAISGRRADRVLPARRRLRVFWEGRRGLQVLCEGRVWSSALMTVVVVVV